MNNSLLKLVALLIFAIGLGVAGTAAGKLVMDKDAEGNKPQGGALLSAWATGAVVPFGLGIVLMIGGGIFARRLSKDTKGSSKETLEDPAELLASMASTLEKLDVNEDGTADAIADVLEERIPQLLEHRDAWITAYGVGGYAEFAGDFASFERNTARAWSALTDGVPTEAERCIIVASAALKRATENYEKLIASV